MANSINIGVATLDDEQYRLDNPTVCEIASRNKLEYCLRHNYSLHLVKHSLVDDRPTVWSKIPLISNLLNLHDWIFWADQDCLFMNFNIRLEDIIDPAYEMVITQDMYGLSAGNFFIKKGDWAKELFERAWREVEQCRDHWGQEQLAMELTLQNFPHLNAKVKYVPQNQICSYHNVELTEEYRSYMTGDFIVHFPSHYGKPTLPEFMQSFSQEVIL